MFETFHLNAKLLSAIEAAGYKTPTPIQQQAIPLVLAGRDVLGLAQTGTGKTAAFVLPLLQKLGTGTNRIRALILAPTRELAEQIHQTITMLGKDSRLRSITIYGGVSKKWQLKELQRGADIVVACPGRLLDHIHERNINLNQIEMLVIDEADRMCDMGFLPDVKRILNTLPREKQTLLFSATMPEDIRTLANNLLKHPAKVQIGIISAAQTVSHALYPVPEGKKFPALLQLLETKATGRVLIFTRTKYRTRDLKNDLSKRGYKVAQLQGNMSQNQRMLAMNGFRDGKFDLLVATDIAARGIDVSDISHVINFDIPETADAYIHRIGRTGRAEQTGEALTLIVPSDEAMVRDVEKVLKEQLERRKLEGFDYTPLPPRENSQRSSSRPNTQSQRRPKPAGNRNQGNQFQDDKHQGSKHRNPSTPANEKITQPSRPARGNQSGRPAQGSQASRPARGNQNRRRVQGKKFSR